MTGLKLPAKIQLLKQDMEEKEEHAGGEYDIDNLKIFKLVSSSVVTNQLRLTCRIHKCSLKFVSSILVVILVLA